MRLAAILAVLVFAVCAAGIALKGQSRIACPDITAPAVAGCSHLFGTIG